MAALLAAYQQANANVASGTDVLANTLSGGTGPSGDGGGTPGGGSSGETPFAKAAGFLEIVRCKSRRLRRGVDGNIEASLKKAPVMLTPPPGRVPAAEGASWPAPSHS